MPLPKPPPKTKWAAAMQAGQAQRDAKAAKAREAAKAATEIIVHLNPLP
ncbi:hypothetical protein [Caulobacter hibisci]|uniref:Uncharacterized protein n=1 Tax=Caulobacter hibisci TaxID=2035993 RepID=A0ABS0STZ7_9CAUL|nr:hypothetical protein [Caulobacter hibisci]MBI1682425.1 hypothetical protein [Caulobacter hibisci]